MHIIEDDLAETLEDFAAAGIRLLEDYLLVVAAFRAEYPDDLA